MGIANIAAIARGLASLFICEAGVVAMGVISDSSNKVRLRQVPRKMRQILPIMHFRQGFDRIAYRHLPTRLTGDFRRKRFGRDENIVCAVPVGTLEHIVTY